MHGEGRPSQRNRTDGLLDAKYGPVTVGFLQRWVPYVSGVTVGLSALRLLTVTDDVVDPCQSAYVIAMPCQRYCTTLLAFERI